MKNKLTFSNILFLILTVLLFSFEMHSLWLIYDISLIYLLTKINFKDFILYNGKIVSLFTIVIIFFIYTLYKNGIYLISFISIWDTLKHTILFIYFIQNKNKLNYSKTNQFLQLLYLFLTITFFIQAFYIFVQTFILKIENFDNICGTLGNYSTHAIGLFSLLVIITMIYQKRVKLLSIILLLSIIINILGRNEGYFVLLLTLVFYFMIKKILYSAKIIIKYIPIIILFFLVIIMIIFIFKIQLHDYSTIILNKLDAYYINIGDINKNNILIQTNIQTGRGSLLDYSVQLGEYFGNGFGAYSSIYNKDGWLIDSLLNIEICISEASHLISETGIIGFIIISIIYLHLIKRMLGEKFIINFWGVFFIFNMFYNRLLMDERHIFIYFLVLIVISLKKYLINNQNK